MLSRLGVGSMASDIAGASDNTRKCHIASGAEREDTIEFSAARWANARGPIDSSGEIPTQACSLLYRMLHGLANSGDRHEVLTEVQSDQSRKRPIPDTGCRCRRLQRRPFPAPAGRPKR